MGEDEKNGRDPEPVKPEQGEPLDKERTVKRDAGQTQLWRMVVGPITAVVVIIGITVGLVEWRLVSIRDKIGEVSETVTAINDPQTGYPKAVRDGVADAVARAADKDQIIRGQLAGAIKDALSDALRENREALDRMRSEVVAELRAQTGQLSADINGLRGDLTDVRFRQNILLQHILGHVPEDPVAFLKMQEKLGAGVTAPIWVMKEDAYSFWQKTFMGKEFGHYRWEVSGPFKN